VKQNQHTTLAGTRTTTTDVCRWVQSLFRLHARIAPRFARSEPRGRVLAYLQGILSDISRKNGWHLAEHVREARPDGMQRLLSQAVWDTNGVRDDLRAYALEQLGTECAILGIDETSFPKILLANSTNMCETDGVRRPQEQKKQRSQQRSSPCACASEGMEPVPEETARLARIVCRPGTLCLLMRDELGEVFQDELFTSLFPRRGQPAEAPWRLAMITVLQFAEGLTDRQAANAVRTRIDVKYAG
jgi:DDE superfamily endonuclease/Transposase domain (DUF772)